MTEQNPAYKKKLIEVAMPLDVINKASQREKSIRHGHPSTFHLWWARRPLAACRAVLFSSIVDDPGNYLSPDKAEIERKRLFRIIGKLVQWKSTNDKAIMSKIQKEIQKYVDDSLCIYDPFSGGGSIPLESQRLGINTYGSDINPVAVLIGKSLIETPHRFVGKPPVNPESLVQTKSRSNKVEGLVADVLYYGNVVLKKAKEKIGHLYPQINDKTVIANIWARTVTCPNPACGYEMPLVRSFVVSSIRGKTRSISPIKNESQKRFNFQIIEGKPKVSGTVKRTGAKCLACNEAIPFPYIRKEGRNKGLPQRLMATVLSGNKGREYLAPNEKSEKLANELKPHNFPETKLPEQALGFRVQTYGMTQHSDLFTKRQLVALTTFSDSIKQVHQQIINDAIKVGMDKGVPLESGGKGASAYADAITTYLAFTLDRMANRSSTICIWNKNREGIEQTFGRQAIPMTWDFAENNPFSNSTGSWDVQLRGLAKVLQVGLATSCTQQEGKIEQLDSSSRLSNTCSAPIICTDPPYYDNIGYADLSDFFYIWLRRTISEIYPSLFKTVLTPKCDELIATPHRFDGDKKKAEKHFLSGLGKAFHNIAEKANPNFPITIFYAFKQSEKNTSSDGQETFSSTGWETMLIGLISAGLEIKGTWPIRTERDQGLKTGDNVLASSIVLVCRRRPLNSPLATRKDFLSGLKKELPSALRNFQEAGISPVDIAQAAIGPGMAVFSRYSKVLEADGNPMRVKTALQLINQELACYFSEQETDLDKETRFCIAWFEQFGWNNAPFGIAEGLMKAKNTAINSLEAAGIAVAKAGKVRLLKREELEEDWDPTTDKKLTVWECVQYLIKALDDKGESEAAQILNKIGGLSISVKELAYRLYSLCAKKGWTEDGLAYNNLISSWESINDKAQFGARISEQKKKKLKDKSQKTLFDL